MSESEGDLEINSDHADKLSDEGIVPQASTPRQTFISKKWPNRMVLYLI